MIGFYFILDFKLVSFRFGKSRRERYTETSYSTLSRVKVLDLTFLNLALRESILKIRYGYD